MKVLKIVIFVLSSLFLVQLVHAECMYHPGPLLIGEVVDYYNEGSATRVYLRDLSVLHRDLTKLFPLNGSEDIVDVGSGTRFWILDYYENQAKKFSSNRNLFENVEDFFLEKDFDYGSWWYDSLYEGKNVSGNPSLLVSDKLILEDGDILIKGYPVAFCDYGFIGIFSHTGNIKYVHSINRPSDAFRYKDVEILTKASRKIRGVRVDYVVNGESFSLFPSRSYNTNNEFVSSVSVLSARIPSKKEPLIGVGLNAYVNQIISFSEPLSYGDNTFFSRGWMWLKGLFSS